MIPYMVGKLAPNSTHFTRGLVKYVSGRVCFRAVPSENGDKSGTSPPSLIVERLFRVFSARPSFPRFSHHAHNSSGFSCAYSPLLHQSCSSLFVPVLILHSFVSLHRRSRSRSVPFPIIVLVLYSAPEPILVSVSVCVFPSLAPGYPLGSMCVYTHRALRTELSGARKRHPLHAEIMTGAE